MMYANNYFSPNYGQGVITDMLNGYKQPYQNQMPVQMGRPTGDMIWVQGEAGAKGYPVAPNCTVVLWDSESSTIYVKTADGTGIPTMRTLDFVERTGAKEHKCNCGENFVSKAQFEELTAKVNALTEKIESEE